VVNRFSESTTEPAGRDGALRCPRRVEAARGVALWHVARDSFLAPLIASGGDRSAMSPGAPETGAVLGFGAGGIALPDAVDRTRQRREERIARDVP